MKDSKSPILHFKLVPFWEESFEQPKLKESRPCSSEGPCCLSSDPTTVKFICKTFQSVEQEDKYRADKKVS